MTASETLRTVTRILAGVYKAQFSLPLELTYEAHGWKTCQQVSRDGVVTEVYKYDGEPSSLFPLTVTIFSSTRHTNKVVIPEEKGVANDAGKRFVHADV